MNKNILKLQRLVKETTNVIDNLKKEAADLEAEYNENRQAKLDKILMFLKSLTSITEQLDYDVDVQIKINGNCYIVNIWDEDAVIFNKNSIDLALPWASKYASLKRRLRDFDEDILLDNFIDSFDQGEFEIAFAEEVQRILKVMAKEANQDYDDAKIKLKGLGINSER